MIEHLKAESPADVAKFYMIAYRKALQRSFHVHRFAYRSRVVVAIYRSFTQSMVPG